MGELTTTQAVRTYNTHYTVLGRLSLIGRLKARKDSNGRWLIEKTSLGFTSDQRSTLKYRV